MKNIVFIITSLQNYGGTERVATLLANRLSDNHNITILSRDINGKKNAYHLLNNVTDKKFKTNSLGFLNSIKQYINHESPDIVVIHTMSKLTPCLLLSGLKAKNIWSLEHTSFLFSPFIFRTLRKLLYHKVDKVIALTQRDKLNYLSFVDNAYVIPNISPFPITNKEYNAESKTIITIGNLEHHKGYDLLLKAWEQVTSLHPEWKLEIYGAGSERANLEKYCNNKQLTTVEFRGVTTCPLEVYDSAALYVMSSRYEGLPLVLIEAQSRGLPIVSFDCPYGPAEVVHHNVDGLLVPLSDVSALAQSIIRLIENQSLRKEYSLKARKSAEKFTETYIINKWLSLIEGSL